MGHAEAAQAGRAPPRGQERKRTYSPYLSLCFTVRGAGLNPRGAAVVQERAP
jgi:hypothetical protein